MGVSCKFARINIVALYEGNTNLIHPMTNILGSALTKLALNENISFMDSAFIVYSKTLFGQTRTGEYFPPHNHKNSKVTQPQSQALTSFPG